MLKDIFLRENIFEILDYITEGIQIIDNQGRIVYFNRAAQRMEDIDGDKTIGRHILEIYPSLSFETSTFLSTIRTGKPIFDVEQTFKNYKGDKIVTVNSTIPIKYNDKVKGAIEISRDITQVKVLSEKIVDLQSELYEGKPGKRVKQKGTADYTFVDIVGESKKMLSLKSLALKASQIDSPVLIYGETGTGKELFVQSIHNSSPRRHKPFIAQNCAALPVNLLEGILFGTTKGGFTGAEDRLGLFELANKGTLFLDEINSMPLELQAKLLRVLQDGTIRRVGSVKTVNVDVRIITALNIPPERAIDEKMIRKDLYYRLNVINLNIPPLRERKDDISILIKYFIKKYNERFNKNFKRVSRPVMNRFIEYSWPGNVRELQHVMEGIISMYEGDVVIEEFLPQQFIDMETDKKETKAIRPLNEAVEEVEKSIIIEALNKTNWNITKTGEIIDIPRQTLQYKIKKYKLKR